MWRISISVSISPFSGCQFFSKSGCCSKNELSEKRPKIHQQKKKKNGKNVKLTSFILIFEQRVFHCSNFVNLSHCCSWKLAQLRHKNVFLFQNGGAKKVRKRKKNSKDATQHWKWVDCMKNPLGVNYLTVLHRQKFPTKNGLFSLFFKTPLCMLLQAIWPASMLINTQSR